MEYDLGKQWKYSTKPFLTVETVPGLKKPARNYSKMFEICWGNMRCPGPDSELSVSENQWPWAMAMVCNCMIQGFVNRMVILSVRLQLNL